MILLYPNLEQASASARTQPTRSPPPLRLPRHIQQQLAKPLRNSDDVDELMKVIQAADARGLL